MKRFAGPFIAIFLVLSGILGWILFFPATPGRSALRLPSWIVPGSKATIGKDDSDLGSTPSQGTQHLNTPDRR